MSSLEDFWVAIATAAPVVALGHIVLVERTTRAFLEEGVESLVAAVETARRVAQKTPAAGSRRARGLIGESLRLSSRLLFAPTPSYATFLVTLAGVISSCVALWSALDALRGVPGSDPGGAEALVLISIGLLLLQGAVLAVRSAALSQMVDSAMKKRGPIERAEGPDETPSPGEPALLDPDDNEPPA